MPIIHFRVDQRMIHGQVAISWSKAVNPNHIILANDKVADDMFQQSILKVAAPKQTRLSMVTVEKTIRYINRGLAPNENVFLLTQNIHDARTIFDNALLGNYGSLNIGNMTYKEGAKKLNEKIFATQAELDDILWFIKNGVDIYFQMLPNDEKESFKELVKGA